MLLRLLISPQANVLSVLLHCKQKHLFILCPVSPKAARSNPSLLLLNQGNSFSTNILLITSLIGYLFTKNKPFTYTVP